MIDPTSAVREGEFARSTAGQSIINQLSGKAQQALQGGVALADGDRKAILDAAQRLYSGYNELYNSKVNEYRGYAEDMGLDPDKVVKPLINTQTGTCELYLDTKSFGVRFTANGDYLCFKNINIHEILLIKVKDLLEYIISDNLHDTCLSMDYIRELPKTIEYHPHHQYLNHGNILYIKRPDGMTGEIFDTESGKSLLVLENVGNHAQFSPTGNALIVSGIPYKTDSFAKIIHFTKQMAKL